MIDDELLQELLVRATGLYNNGDYRGAITAWREALAVDPASQKAKEGIQMATLLLADWDPATSFAAPEPAPAADGGEPRPSQTKEADAQRIDAGVKRVRRLLLERKYSEAIEGARGLVPIDPDSEEVQRLVDEAQQAFESAPFIDEHLTLTRELLEQGRRDEAEAECRKVFTLDPANPDAHALLAEVQGQAKASAAAAPEPPAGDLGGRTMRIDRSQLQAFQFTPDAPAAPDAADAVETAGETESPDSFGGDLELDMAAAPDAAAAGEPESAANTEAATPAEADAIEFGDLPELPENLTAGAEAAAEPELDFLPEESLELSDGAGAAGHETAEVASAAAADAGDTVDAPMEIPLDADEPSPAAEVSAETPAPGAAEPEVIEATTVVPPSVRLVERSPEGQAAIDRLMQQLDEDESVESIPLALPTPPTPPASAAPKTPPVAAKEAVPPGRSASQGAEGGWEEELESLNRKSGEHDIVGRSASRAAAPSATPDEDLDLTALMGDELGPLQGAPASESAQPVETPIEVHEPTVPTPSVMDAEPGPARAAVARARAQERAARIAGVASAGDRRGRSMTSLFALCGVVILVAAAAIWWFFFQPRNALGRSQAPTAPAPPSASSGPAHVDGPIPTPIGSTSRQPDPADRNAPSGDGADGTAPDNAEPAPAGAPAAGGSATQTSAQAPATHVPGANGSPNPAPAAAPAAARPRTAEELRAETAQHLTAGRTFLAQEKWQDARRELAAALALDPVNFECKELLQKAQAKVDQETRVNQEYDEARALFQDKDYQGALWKLYRLPKDPRYGNLDVPIANSWYNWAVVALKGGDATTAIQKLNEVLQVNADDAGAQKTMDVASQYQSRAKDKGFYSFVDTLRFRSFDGK
ncbi:MAG TPA: hypothetical protein VGS03_00095 [Candidatus Polarisedimenticolia bacterium]|nr:hypothetical protein [Candidatus Polarisedimenticolia bacterium]